MPTLTGAERTRLGPQLNDIKKRQFALKKQAKLKYETSPNNNLDYLLEGKNFLFTKIQEAKIPSQRIHSRTRTSKCVRTKKSWTPSLQVRTHNTTGITLALSRHAQTMYSAA
jgi:hypothetical protein